MIIVEIAGRLGRKPESRFTTSGLKVTSFSVATNIKRAGKEEAVWWRVTVWGDRHDKMISYLDKGSAVIVIGEMQQKPEIRTDKEGRQQINLEITAEMIKFSPFGQTDRSGQERGATAQSTGQSTTADAFNEDMAGDDYGAPSHQQSSSPYTPASGYGTNSAAGAYSAPAEDQLPF